MRIAVDYRPLQSSYAQRGVGTFLRNIFSRLSKSRIGPSLMYLGWTGHEHDARPSQYRTVFRPRVRPWIWEQLLWPLDLKRLQVDVFHSTVSLGPLREIGFPYFCPVPSIATVYDLNSLKVPQLGAHGRTKSFRIQREALKKAGHIVTISNYVKNDIISMLGIPDTRITVLPCAVDDTLRAIHDSNTYGKSPLSVPFILAMGETENKNIVTVLRVFERLAAQGFEGSLCIVGTFDGQTPRVKRTWKNSRYQNRMIFLGELSTHHLVSYYAACEFFFFPSLAEGFGLPVIEAMYCGAPVITSNATSLPEVTGSAAIVCPPADIKGYTTEANRLLNEWDWRGQVIRNSRKHAQSFSWDPAVDTLISLYENLAAKPR